MSGRKFTRAERGKYSLEEKEALGNLCKKYKIEYDEKMNSASGQVNFNVSRKKHTNPALRQGYIAKAVREFYSDLKDVKHDDHNLEAAIKLGKRCYEQLTKSESEVTVDH